MTELAFISLKTMDGKPCGFARLSGGFAELRLLEPLAGQAAVLTDGGVFSGAAGSRIAFSGRVLAVALHRDGRLLCMGLPRGAAITPDRIRAQLIPELTPTPYHPPREAQVEPVRETAERRVEPLRESAEKRAEPMREPAEKRAEPVRESAERRAEPGREPAEKRAEPVREPAGRRAEPVLAGAATRGRVEQGTPSVPPTTAQAAAQAQTGSISAAQSAFLATEQAGMPVWGSVEPAAVEAKSEPVREPADPPAQPTLAGQEKADPSMSASRREAQRTAEPMRADAEPAPKEEAARAVKAARQPQAEMVGGVSGQSPGIATQNAAAGRSENSAPNAQETAADTESFMALLRRADRAFAAVMHREPPAIPPAAQTGGMRRSARYEAAGTPHTMPRSERADAGMADQVGFDGVLRESYALRATPRSERADAGMTGQTGFDGVSRESHAPHTIPRSEQADAGMFGQAGLDGASRESYAPHITPRSERVDTGITGQAGLDGAMRETYAPRATPRSERTDAGMTGQAGLDGAMRESYAHHATPHSERVDAGITGQAGFDGVSRETYAPRATPHSERVDVGMTGNAGFDGASRETYAPHTTPHSERADAGMAGQAGFDGVSRETYAPHTTPRPERADAGMTGQAGLDGAMRETYAPRATPRSERADAGMAGQAGFDGASRETYAPRATPHSERADAGMTGQAGLDGAMRETYAPHTTSHSERTDAGIADRDTPDGAAMAVQGTPLLNGRRLYTGLHGAAGEWCEEVERLLDNAPSDNRGEPIANPFPNIFPGAKFLRIRKPGVPTYLRGDWRSGHGAAGERMRITAVPGAYSPHPPAHLTGFTRYIRARSGGYWIRVEEWSEP